MTILLALLTFPDARAVVNNGKSKTEEENKSASDVGEINQAAQNTAGDVTVEDAEDTSIRREAHLDVSYGAPVSVSVDSYQPSGTGNLNLPVPVYGVPNAPSNNIIYPKPPPDIPPLSQSSHLHGPAHNLYLSPPKPLYGPPNIKYDVPSFNHRKPFNGGGGRYGPPRFQYGPPGKPLFNSKHKKFNYGNYKFSKPPNTYGPPPGSFKKSNFNHHFTGDNHLSHGNTLDISGFGNGDAHIHTINLDISGINSNSISTQYGSSDVSYNNYKVQEVAAQYGPPQVEILGPKPIYGPPQPSPHPRPPHPGAPAPPTPPDIKYDGWQPIPGLISIGPLPTYGVPQDNYHVSTDLSYSKDLTPPLPSDAHNVHHNHHDSTRSQGSLSSVFVDTSLSSQASGVKDSYGAPLNIVTGSGEVVRTSGNEAHSHHNDHDSGQEGHLGFSSSGLSLQSQHSHHSNQIADSYGVPEDSYSPNGAYSASHNVQFNGKYRGSSSSSLGLIPPSGLYGIPPDSQYGTPLFSSSVGLDTYKLPSPKHPVVHREPVPTGLIDSIVNKNQHYAHHFTTTYLPPPVRDIPAPSKQYGVPGSSNLFRSSNHQATSFQNVQHSSSNPFNLNLNEGLSGISSYDIPLNTADGTYNSLYGKNNGQFGSDVVSLDLSHPGVTIDLTSDHSAQSLSSLSGSNDCNKKQQLPSLSYGVPSANSYTAALETLTTNIGGSYQNTAQALPVPQAQTGYQTSEQHNTYGDLSTSHTQKVHSEVNTNLIENGHDGKEYGKSVAQSFGPSSELIQSQSIDLNNIPLQGALGSYSLQIQSADGKSNGVPHGQVLNDGLLQSILAAIEQPQKGGTPIIQLQKSLEKQNFVTNETISSVVEQLTDAEIRHSTQLAKNAIESTASDHYDSNIEHSSPELSIVAPSAPQEESSETRSEVKDEDDKRDLEFREDTGIALYFNKNAHLERKSSTKDSAEDSSR